MILIFNHSLQLHIWIFHPSWSSQQKGKKWNKKGMHFNVILKFDRRLNICSVAGNHPDLVCAQSYSDLRTISCWNRSTPIGLEQRSNGIWHFNGNKFAINTDSISMGISKWANSRQAGLFTTSIELFVQKRDKVDIHVILQNYRSSHRPQIQHSTYGNIFK